MKITALTGLAAMLLVHSTYGWTFTWRDVSGTPGVADGDDNHDCTPIKHSRGQEFEWDRGFLEDCCIRLYRSADCTGTQAGFSCNDWTKSASGNLRSFKVTNC